MLHLFSYNLVIAFPTYSKGNNKTQQSSFNKTKHDLGWKQLEDSPHFYVYKQNVQKYYILFNF